MARFKHESPQAGTRTVDIGVHGTEESVLIGACSYSRYQPYLVIEAKRLPTDRKGREQEYVTGQTLNGSPTGGIQRFKLGLHGSDVEVAAMVGYLQKETPLHWHTTINGWITSLAAARNQDGCNWSDEDKLQSLDAGKETGLSACQSSHKRIGRCATPTIAVHHLWLLMSR